MGFGLALGAIAGGVLGGLGIFKGGSGAGRAAKSMAASTAETMASLRNDVKEIKEHLIKEVWPRLNETLDDVQEVLRETQTFIVTGTFTVKVLALLFIVLAAYFIGKQRTALKWQKTAYSRSPTRVGGSTADIAGALEGIFLQFLYWSCLLMAIVLVLHLIQEVFDVAHVSSIWPENIPFIMIIPSIATLGIILQYLADIISAIANALLLLLYCVFGLPCVLIHSPVSKGSCYVQSSNPLSAVLVLAIMVLYAVTASFPVVYLWEVFNLDKPVFEFVLLSYLVFFATAIAVHLLGEVMLIVVIRPLWVYLAKKSHYN